MNCRIRSSSLSSSNAKTTISHFKNILEAIKSFDKALVIKPNYAEAANYRGIIFQDTGDHENAIKYYNLAYEITINCIGKKFNTKNKSDDCNILLYEI